MKNPLLILTFLLINALLFGQNVPSGAKATYVSEAVYVKKIAPLSRQKLVPVKNEFKIYNPKKQGANKAVIGKGTPVGPDPLWQKNPGQIKGKAPLLTFESASSFATPTDPTGAIGPNHYINAWNSNFAIYDRSGNQLVAPSSLATIFPGENLGDPIVIYDRYADRFVITQFSDTPNGFLIAVSQGPDPVNDGWFTYRFNTDSFPDYPKYSIWSDGYYITANKDQFSPDTNEVVFALERDKLLTGSPVAKIIGFPLPGIEVNGFYSPLGFNTNGSELPPLGNAPIVYMQDDAWANVTSDHLKIWNINVDWAIPANSTISAPQQLPVTAFDGLFDGGSFVNLPQPSGSDIDALQATIMYMAQYRRFPTHNSVVFNFVVDLDGNDNLAGIRWYELRQVNDGDPWTVYQEGTYAQPDGHSAFSGAMAIDNLGNIGMGYTIVSSTMFPSLRFTGRFVGDMLGEMTLAEETVVNGTQINPNSRYGDYSQMTIDPVDDQTMWFTGEYFSGGARKNHVGVFKVASDTNNDVGIVAITDPQNGILSNSEQITVTIRNYGLTSQSNFDVTYQIDGGTVVTETFTNTIAAGADDQFTFTTTANMAVQGQNYQITAGTDLTGDENSANDIYVTNRSNLFSNDVGIEDVFSPLSGVGLSANETISVRVRNYGGLAQSNVDVSYSVDGGSAVMETIPAISANSFVDYSFSTGFDFSAINVYNVSATTQLPGDQNAANDTKTATVQNAFCQPISDCTYGDGITSFQLGTISNLAIACNTGYEDFTGMVTDLDRSTGTFNLAVQTGYAGDRMSLWIDFNDNSTFEPSEQLLTDVLLSNANTTVNINLVIPGAAALGEHLLRIRAGDIAFSGDLNNPCDPMDFATTHDYKVNITDSTLSTDKFSLKDSEFVILYKGNKQHEISLSSLTVTEPLEISVYNMLGQQLVANKVINISGVYSYDLDMSYAPSGIYLIRIGNDTRGGKVKRILVQ
ncbi:GEVED domain-containing protein [Leptobacterium sp. I13]|uniref:GEVED domain-containing protein n=1 Tax=Leptobacterium meishanense TaxID=3128904 RepID=UPI0030EF0E56